MTLTYKKSIPKKSMPAKIMKHSFVDEAMVDLSEYFMGRILIEPIYYNNGLKGAIEKCCVRESVAKKLERAIELLPDEYMLKVFDAWRPLTLQQELYEKHFNSIQAKHPDWSKAQTEQETTKFVSLPNCDIETPAAHSTGGAIDLTIAFKDSGKELDMGTSFDDFTCLSHTNAFECRGDKYIKHNRRLLYWIMINSGFTNLPSEWWHYDYGDSFWGYYKNMPAIYCGILDKIC